MSLITSLRFFAPSLLGTSSLRADVAASVGDNFFLRKLKKVCLQARLQGASRAPAAFAGREFLPQKLFLHSRRPTAMGAIAWQRTRRNGQCLLNICKEELSPRSPDGSPACQRRAPLCQNVRPARVKLQLYPAMG